MGDPLFCFFCEKAITLFCCCNNDSTISKKERVESSDDLLTYYKTIEGNMSRDAIKELEPKY